jgi:hypothetical protein
MNIKVKKLNVNDIQSNSVVVIHGKRDTGKTILMKDLLNKKQDIINGVILSAENHENVDNLLNDFTEIQTTNDKSYLVLDDIYLNNKEDNEKQNKINELITNNRSYVILTYQYPYQYVLNKYSKIDWVFLFKENNVNGKKRLYDFYGTKIFPNFDVFSDIMNNCTSNHECLVIHLSSQSDNMEDKIFFYKANSNHQ